MIVIRQAVQADAAAVAALAESTFRATFASTNTADDMDLHCQQTYSESTQASEIADARMLTLVAEVGETSLAAATASARPVGYAQVRWMDAPQCVTASRPGEVYRLYVSSDWHGKGVAQALMTACLTAIAQRGCDVAWLGVWEHNPRALAFYRKFGFDVVGDHVFTVGTDPQRDLVMSRRVPTATSPDDVS